MFVFECIIYNEYRKFNFIVLAPEHPFPAARDNMLECYQWLVNEKKISPSKIAFGTYFDNLFKLIF